MNQTMTVTFEQRDFSGRLNTTGITWTVEELNWRAVGGPFTARLRADGEAARLGRLADLLRCGVQVHDARGAAWWGYVSAVTLHNGQSAARVDLDGMFNKVAVWYRDVVPDVSGGTRRITPWMSDAESTALYGTKEKSWAVEQASRVDAEALANGLLAQRKTPAARVQPDQAGVAADRAGGGALWATVEARGWWDTLDWKYYSEARGWAADTYLGVTYAFGVSSAEAKVAESFTCGTAEGWSLSDVWVRLKRFRATDTVVVEICANNGGSPGTVLGSKSVSYQYVQEDYTWIWFELNDPIALAAGTTYWLVVSRGGAVSASNYYSVSLDESTRYAPGVFRIWNGTSWVARSPSPDLTFALAGSEDTLSMLGRILAAGACGQFLSGVQLEPGASGVQGRLYREGSQRGRAEAEAMLRKGMAGGARLLARVEPGRAARVYEQPANGTARVRVDPGGVLRARGNSRALEPSEQPAGCWLWVDGLDRESFAEAVRWTARDGLRVRENG